MKRIQDLEEQIAKTKAEFQDKEHTLNEQITMWKEKSKIKQQNFIKQEEEFQKEMGLQKEKMHIDLSQKDQQIADLNIQMKKKNEEVAKVEKDFMLKKEELQISQDDRTTIMTSLSEKDLELDKLRDQIAMLNSKLEHLNVGINGSNESLLKERENFTIQLKQRVEQIAKLTQENQELQTKNSDIEDRLSTARVGREQ